MRKLALRNYSQLKILQLVDDSSQSQHSDLGLLDLEGVTYFTLPCLLKNQNIFPLESSVAQSCPTLCDPMYCSMLDFLVHHQLLQLAQIHVDGLSDAIRPPHAPSPLLLLPCIFPNIKVFSNRSALCIRQPKYWSFSFSISPSNEYSGLISFRIDWLDFLAVQGTLQESSPTPVQKHQFFSAQLSFQSNSHIHR